MNRHVTHLVKTLKSDRKKALLLGGMVAVGMLLWGRLLLKQVPRTATAVPDVAAEVSGSDLDLEALAAVAEGRPVVRLELPTAPDRDLFEINPSHYNRTAASDNADLEPNNRPGVSDDQEQRQLARLASGLRLQSVVLGTHPRAMINGRMLEVGQQIDGFTLLELDLRTAVLEIDGQRVRLRM
jgi:hypothetical protein